MNNQEQAKKQYKTAGNLNSRAALHQLFSTNKLGWTQWVFQNYELQPGQKILELGCGNGGIWASRAAQIPEVSLVLSDFSKGMLRTAKDTLHDMPNAEFMVIDAQDIPFSDDSFDIVIANHMLYHVPDLGKAVKEIARVLKPGGTLYATTLGAGNFKEMFDLLHVFDPSIAFAPETITGTFGLETGEAKLRGHFAEVEIKRHPDSLHVTQAQPLVDYVQSLHGFGNITEILQGEKAAQFGRYVENIIARDGAIDISKDAGMFVARKGA